MSGTLLAGGKWLSFQNRSSETVPPFGVMRISGSKIPNDGEAYLYCDRPDNYGSLAATVINSACAVQPQAYGGCTRNWPAFVAFDDQDGNPQPGEIWGPVENSFKLRKYAPGFLIVTEPQLDGVNRGVLVLPDFTSLLRVSLDAELDSSSEVNSTILKFSSGSWSSTPIKKKVRLWKSSETLDPGTECAAEQCSGSWWVAPIECPEE